MFIPIIGANLEHKRGPIYGHLQTPKEAFNELQKVINDKIVAWMSIILDSRALDLRNSTFKVTMQTFYH